VQGFSNEANDNNFVTQNQTDDFLPVVFLHANFNQTSQNQSFYSLDLSALSANSTV